MDEVESSTDTLEEYKALESEFYRNLMGVCRRYVSQLSVVSLNGILDIVMNGGLSTSTTSRSFLFFLSEAA